MYLRELDDYGGFWFIELLFTMLCYFFQAPSLPVKEMWVKEIKRVLMNQFDQIKGNFTFLFLESILCNAPDL